MDTGQIEKRWLCIKKWMTRLVAAATACSLLLPISAYAADNQKIGYGQGTAVDAENCPLDALQFDQQFQKFGAYATTPDRKQIILTFDQGYENGYTAKILDVLQEKQAHAIFFLTGDYAKSESELVHRMIEEGHTLGNHGMTHASLPTLLRKRQKKKFFRCTIMWRTRMAMKCSISAVRAANILSRRWRLHRNVAIRRCFGALRMWIG